MFLEKAKLTVLFVNVAADVAEHSLTKGQIVDTFLAAVAGQDTSVVVLPSITDVSVAEGLVADRDGAAAGAPVGLLATTVTPEAGVVQLKGVTNTGCSPAAMFLSHVKV